VERTVGLERSWLAAIPGVLVSLLVASQFRRLDPHRRHPSERPALAELKPVLGPLAQLYVTVVCRSAVSYGFMTFLPIHLHRHGYSVAAGGAVLTAYLGAGAVGGLAGGWLADHWGGRRVVRNSFIGGLPLFVAFLFLPDVPGLMCLVAGSFILQGSLPVNVVLGQELSPRHSSTISSLLMGAAWGVGALLIGPVGALADRFGLRSALLALTALLVAGLACALALPPWVGRPRGVGPVVAGAAVG
jgi:FSR family fosmidomycin resistance protein-like MFS transporter